MASNPAEAHRKPYEPRHRLWTRDEYHRDGDLGIFRPDERLELLLGQIIVKPPQSVAHTTSIRLATRALEKVFGPSHEIRYQMPVVLSESSEPEPDVLVLKKPLEAYEDRQPEARDVLLIVEVVDGTRRTDWHVKSVIYATAGIPEYWAIDLERRQLSIYQTANANGVYTNVRVYEEGDNVAADGAPGSQIRVADLLPIKR